MLIICFYAFPGLLVVTWDICFKLYYDVEYLSLSETAPKDFSSYEEKVGYLRNRIYLNSINLVLAGIWCDLNSSYDFLENQYFITVMIDMKASYVSLARAYKTNEEKIYYRICDMLKKKELDDMMDKILNATEASLKPDDFKLNYLQQDVSIKIYRAADKIKQMY